MNILVCPNTTIVSGASLVALDLAAAMRERGHRVLVLGPPGDLVDRFEPLGLEWIEGPDTDDGSDPERSARRMLWPSTVVLRQIRRVVAEEAIDVVHTYEWPRCLEADWGAHLIDGVPLVSSILSVHAPKYLPRTAHIVVGAENLVALLRSRGFPNVTLVLPRLDRTPSAGPAAAEAFTAWHGLDDGVAKVVIASRLAAEKMDGLRLLIDAVELVDQQRPVQLVIAGEGSGAQELRDRAEPVNARLGRRAVVFVGLLSDVSPAYAIADVVAGMGSAALSAMAHGKPVIVVGQDGFSELLTEDTADALGEVGFWGVGEPDGAAERLAAHIADALRDPVRTAELARCSLSVVGSRPTKEDTEALIERVYLDAMASVPSAPRRFLHAVRSLCRFSAMRARAHLARRRARRHQR